MTLLAIKLALKEISGGFRSFRVFILCLALGTFCLSAINSTIKSIESGLDQKAAEMIGGDINIKFTYRFATESERKLIDTTSLLSSETTDFRSMASILKEGKTQKSTLIQIRGVDEQYPLFGDLEIEPVQPLYEALKKVSGSYGLIADETLIDQLSLRIGDKLRIGSNLFELRAKLLSEPSSRNDMFSFAPLVIAYNQGLIESDLLGQGTMFDTNYQLKQKPKTQIKDIKMKMMRELNNSGAVWSDRTEGIPQLGRFIEQLNLFLLLITIAGLIIGGIGVALSVKTYLDGRSRTIATLKSLGASEKLIFHLYLTVILFFSIVGSGFGSLFGTLFPIIFEPLITRILSIPLVLEFYFVVALKSLLHGFLIALLFSIWPLGQLVGKNVTALIRDSASSKNIFPGGRYRLLSLVVAFALVFSFSTNTNEPFLICLFFLGIITCLTVCFFMALLLKRAALLLTDLPLIQNTLIFRFAFSSICGPKTEIVPVTLSLGMGLLTLVALVQIDRNLMERISNDLRAKSPAFFVLDIQSSQLDKFKSIVLQKKYISDIDTAPMLRGVIKKINGVNAKEAIGDHWIIRGDRGISFSNKPPENNKVVAGTWWNSSYDGEPQISFSAEVASQINLSINDFVTVNILGKDIKARVTSFRDVQFSSMRINFLIVMNPSALRGAPYTSIATIYMPEIHEVAFRNIITTNFPNITLIPTRKIVTKVSKNMSALSSVAQATTLITIITAVIVLISVAASVEKTRVYESCLLKALGASNFTILSSFVLRSALMGLGASIVAIVIATGIAWGVLTFVFESKFVLDKVSVFNIALIGMLINALSGLFFARIPLKASVAKTLRYEN